MTALDELLQNAQTFNENENFQEVTDLLTEKVLETYKSADLYAEQAQAYFRLKKYDLAEAAADKALQINDNQTKAIHYKANSFAHQTQYQKAIEYFQKSIELDPNLAQPYHGLGYVYNELKQYDKAINAYQKAIILDPCKASIYNNLGNTYYYLKQYDKAIDTFQKAIKIDPNFAYPYHGLGNVYNDLKQYEKAIDAYKKTIELDSNLVHPYIGLGNVYKELERYDEAIDNYQKAIKLDSNFAYHYHGLGNVYKELERYDEAIDNYQKAIELDPNYEDSYYNLGLAYGDIENYKEALACYEKYIQLNKDESNYFVKSARSQINELKKLIGDAEYSKISELVNKIKNLLLFKDPCVTHYTGISVAQLLILDDSELRLSEGAYLNDTSEGRELFKFLPSFTEPTAPHDTVALPFTPKPFIGSFVAESKHDDLTLWRMYGKENKEEAKGCAITLDRNALLENIQTALTSNRKTDNLKANEEAFSFYRVAYIRREQSEQSSFIVPGAEPTVPEELNQHMTELKALVGKFLKKEHADIPNLLGLLNSIAYLFKTAEYHYEHELRLIVNGVGFKKKVDTYFTPPKVYVELVAIPPLIRKITLGPKVERAEEWASAFYYKLDAESYHPEIMISHLPFK
ncbi:MAG: tetratricopeptide repeat protein [Bacteroidetes bacterium]|nr:tetratricopeptide repeat protein [Bacteroidota bacterium]